ncbi:glutathione S-transferase family protein [Paraliomyxa miuraensis]|uniref:glutathione S-transferase family protein n=1 Tax=Paraliomyxa miuraensis TaxID=376150 RepID=UPI0022549175|nr:glutathione S-transferase family protein [Paraliomyxa miuraensis]MCX4244104.1 glutathione S-transferase family protein [Paraliomyxa miuraensis]
MKYVIHGAPGSGSGIVEAACAELGVDYEARDLDARNDEHRGAAYAAINPQRKLPALELEDGEIITESVAIVLTLDERHRDAGLLPPPGGKERAQALRWMVFIAAELYPMVEIIDHPERFAPGENAAQAMRERAETIWRERWRVLEANIAGTPHCLASGFCATDLFITKLAVWLDRAWRQEHLPKIDALITAVRARPTLEHVWRRHIRD